MAGTSCIEKERSGHKLFELWRKVELIDKISGKRCTSAVKRKGNDFSTVLTKVVP